ncbi:MAG: hypothetical protein K8T25_02345 [Planctomycetia bacterium]|nr:hypothetical protein [Planctomycetia bacterium]
MRNFVSNWHISPIYPMIPSINEEHFQQRHPQIEQWSQTLNTPAKLGHEICDRFLLYFLVLTHNPSLMVQDATETEELSVLYDRYYWFTKAVRLWQAIHGYDAGMEQQAFKILESAPSDLNWEIIREIDDRVTEEVQELAK